MSVHKRPRFFDVPQGNGVNYVRVRPVCEWRSLLDTDEHDARAMRVLNLAQQGYSVRRITYLLNLPHSTVGDIITQSKRHIEPAPFYRMVEF